MTLGSEGFAILLVGFVSLLLGMATGIFVALHSYPLALGVFVLSLLGWGLTFKLSTRV